MKLMFTLTATPFSPEDIINKLIPNGIWPLIAQILTTIVLVIIVTKLVYKPVKAMLDKRAEYIKTHTDQAYLDQQTAALKLTEAEQNLITSRSKAKQIIALAEDDSKKVQQESIEQTKKTVRRMRLEAEQDIENAKLQAQDDIYQEMVNIALEASKQVLEREFIQTDNDKIIEQFIDKGKH